MSDGIELGPEVRRPDLSCCIQFHYGDQRLLAPISNRVGLHLLDYYSLAAGCNTNRTAYVRRDLDRLIVVCCFTAYPNVDHPEGTDLLVRCISALYDWQYDLGLQDATFERVERRTAINYVLQPEFEEITREARGLQVALHEARQFNPKGLAF